VERTLSLRRKIILALGVLAALALVLATGGVLVEKWRDAHAPERVDVNVEDADLSRVMAEISRTVRRPIVVEEGIDEKVTIFLRQIPWRDAVNVIAKLTKCEFEERNGVILISRPRCAMVIEFHDANVRTVLELLAAYDGRRVVFDADVAGTCSVSVQGDKTCWTAFQEVCHECGLRARREEGVVHVASGR